MHGERTVTRFCFRHVSRLISEIRSRGLQMDRYWMNIVPVAYSENARIAFRNFEGTECVVSGVLVWLMAAVNPRPLIGHLCIGAHSRVDGRPTVEPFHF